MSEALSGRQLSEEHKKNVSQALKGRTVSEQTRRRISEANKGRACSAEAKRKISEALSGRKKPPLSEEHKRRISESKRGIHVSPATEFKKGHKVNLGRVFSEETKRKISETKARNPYKHTKETIDKIQASRAGYRHSDETKQKMSLALKGKPSWAKGRTFSEEHRQKIGDALRGKYMGPDGANWRGGVSFTPYSLEWTPTLRRFIRERDGRCMFPECGATVRLAIHHIDYDKMNCDPSNLITLCVVHNGKVNFNREYWEEYFNGSRTVTQP